MIFSAQTIGTLAVGFWLSLSAANHLAAEPPDRQPSEPEQQSPQEPVRHFPKLERNEELEKHQQRQKEIHDRLEKSKEDLKKLDEHTKKFEKREADRSEKIAEYQEARKRWGREWWPLERILFVGVVAFLVVAYRTFKKPEH